ncbi:MAG: hypothetical protein ACTS8P_06255 [Arsenophonus sp. NC-XBC3-MAG3]
MRCIGIMCGPTWCTAGVVIVAIVIAVVTRKQWKLIITLTLK